MPLETLSVKSGFSSNDKFLWWEITFVHTIAVPAKMQGT